MPIYSISYLFLPTFVKHIQMPWIQSVICLPRVRRTMVSAKMEVGSFLWWMLPILGLETCSHSFNLVMLVSFCHGGLSLQKHVWNWQVRDCFFLYVWVCVLVCVCVCACVLCLCHSLLKSGLIQKGVRAGSILTKHLAPNKPRSKWDLLLSTSPKLRWHCEEMDLFWFISEDRSLAIALCCIAWLMHCTSSLTRTPSVALWWTKQRWNGMAVQGLPKPKYGAGYGPSITSKLRHETHSADCAKWI